MQAVKRSAARSAQAARSTARQQRRWAHDAHHDSHSHAHAGPAEEKFGTKFYVGISLIPLTYAFATFSSRPGNYEYKYWTRVINSYDGWRQTWAERNDYHTQALERAAADRNLFINSSFTRHVELKFPEILNTGSPWNVPAGSRANVDQAIAKYEKESYEEQAKKLQQIRDNNVPAEQPYDRPDAGKMQLN